MDTEIDIFPLFKVSDKDQTSSFSILCPRNCASSSMSQVSILEQVHNHHNYAQASWESIGSLVLCFYNVIYWFIKEQVFFGTRMQCALALLQCIGVGFWHIVLLDR
jgi:hypothetical protein